jgi:hypothetical protein
VRKLPVLIAAAAIATVSLAAGGTASADRPELVSAFGTANVGGERAIVHTVSFVQPGANASRVALDSLAAQGARPISKAEFNASGLEWGSGSGGNGNDPVFNYITAGQPSIAGVQSEFVAALAAWNGTSALGVPDLGTSNAACPSLVRECPGKQTSDGHNDVGWVDIKGSSTLGVTWFTKSEADIALDINQNWFVDDDGSDPGTPGAFDIRSVVLHEFGHALGLDHSEVSDSVMNAYYGGVAWAPDCDDIEGMISIYGDLTPTALPGDCPTGDSGGGGGSDPASGTMTAVVSYERSGRGDRDLVVTVTVTDQATGGAVVGAQEWVELEYGGTVYSGGPTTTDSNGQVKWRVRRAPGDKNAPESGWTTTVYLVKSGFDCDTTCTAAQPGS